MPEAATGRCCFGREVSTRPTEERIMNVRGGLEIQGSMRAADELRKRSLKRCEQAGRHKKRPALNFPTRPAAFYALFSRACFTALRSEIASASVSLEKSSLRNASMIVSLGIARLLHRVITLARVNVPSRTFALMAWYKYSLLLFISDSSIDMALPPL